MTDEEIRAGIAADPDAAPELDEKFWKNAKLVRPGKKPTSVRLHREGVAGSGKEGLGAVDEVLRLAVAGKRLVELRYANNVRVVEPHDYGVLKGKKALLAYQIFVYGGDQEGVRGWRLFNVEKISDCSVLKQSFPGSRGMAHKQHHEWDMLYARVA
jgi:hypothetical protein